MRVFNLHLRNMRMTYWKVSCEDSKVDCEFLDVSIEEQTPLEGDIGHL